MTHDVEMQAVAAGRAKTYGVLSALYSAAPTSELAQIIRAGGLIAPDASGPLSAAAHDLTASFRATAAQGPDNELAAEYTQLFVLPSGVLPHEAIYLDESKRLGGHVTVGVQRFYDTAGAELAGACLELPDHFGVELEFMNFLCGIEAQLRQQPDDAALQTCLRFQHDFLAEHLLRWYQPLCERVLQDSSSGAYRALARLTMVFLEAEGELVPQLIDELDSESRTVCVPET